MQPSIQYYVNRPTCTWMHNAYVCMYACMHAYMYNYLDMYSCACIQYIHAHYIVFRWGRLLESVPTHISTSMSAYYAGKQALGFEYYSFSRPTSTNTPEWAYSGASSWAITVYWCGILIVEQHIQQKWNVSIGKWNVSFYVWLVQSKIR